MAKTQGRSLRVPYSQQFTPEQTPLVKLLAVLRQSGGNRPQLQNAIASAFFKATSDPAKLAGNTLISLKYYGIIDDAGQLTPFGTELLRLPSEQVLERLAKRLLLDLDGMLIVETLREMTSAGQEITLQTIPEELRKRNIKASENSSDLSAVFQWLRAAGVLVGKGYKVNDSRYRELVGLSADTVTRMKDLDEGQIAFLRAMVALGVSEATAFNEIARHAENLYRGCWRFNWKDIPKTILYPLRDKGFVEVIEDKKTREGARGGNPKLVRPTEEFKISVAEPILKQMFKNADRRAVRLLSSRSTAEIVSALKTGNESERGIALELLALRICQLLDLQFMGWRETDEEIAGGGEIDGILEGSRLIYSRWQIQCKATPKITIETIAKEVGMVQVSLANVILVVSTGRVTEGAATYRRRITQTTNLNIAFIEGKDLDDIVKNPTAIVTILNGQAEDAMRLRPRAGVLSAENEREA